MRKIKVAFFADMLTEDFDGCIRTIHQIIKRIPKDKFELLFVTGAPPKYHGEEEYFKIFSLTIPFNKNYKMGMPFLDQSKIERKLKAFQPDIIHISNPSPLGNFGSSYAKRNDLPLTTIYHTHYVSYVKYYLRFFNPLINYFEKKVIEMTRNIYEQCNIVYVPVEQIKDDLSALNIDTTNCKIWPRGIDKNLFQKGKRDVSLLQSITGNNKKNILFTSRLVWEKNLKTLIAIYNLAQKKNVAYNFIVVGDGVASNSLQNKMPNAFFMGNLSHDKLSIIYASADVFLFPSDTESYGNVLIEAMASGLPCVSANKGGPTGIIQNGINGFLCESNNAQDYLDKIELLMTDKFLRQSIIKKGLSLTKSMSWDDLVEKFFLDLENLIVKNKYALV